MAAASRTAARSRARRPAPRVRWDRIGRLALLCVLVGVVALYVNPLRTYWSTWQEAKQRRGEVAALKRENEQLRARRAELRGKRALEREARRLGMVRPGERAYVVEGLPGRRGR
jgi:cell division protein FtsB